MTEYSIGDKVQIYTPRLDDLDHRYHTEVGEVVDIFEDDLSTLTDNPSRGFLYTVEFENPELETRDFRYDDLENPDI